MNTLDIMAVFFGVLVLIAFMAVGLLADQCYTRCQTALAFNCAIIGVVVAFVTVALLLLKYLLIPLGGVSL